MSIEKTIYRCDFCGEILSGDPVTVSEYYLKRGSSINGNVKYLYFKPCIVIPCIVIPYPTYNDAQHVCKNCVERLVLDYAKFIQEKESEVSA